MVSHPCSFPYICRFDMSFTVVNSRANVAARIKRNVHCVLEKLIPSITSKRTFRQDVSELATGVNELHSDHWVNIDPVEQPINATLSVLDTCLIVGLRPAMIILITASLFSKMHNKALWRKSLTFGGTNQSLSNKILPTWETLYSHGTRFPRAQ